MDIFWFKRLKHLNRKVNFGKTRKELIFKFWKSDMQILSETLKIAQSKYRFNKD